MIHLGGNLQRASDAPPSPSDPSAKGTLVDTRSNIVGQDYFKTLGIPVLRGRPFVGAETADNAKSAVAILDKAAASRLWPHEEAVGKHIRMILGDGTKTQDAEVVGVVGNVQENIFQGGESQPHSFICAVRTTVPGGHEYPSQSGNARKGRRSALAGNHTQRDPVRGQSSPGSGTEDAPTAPGRQLRSVGRSHWRAHVQHLWWSGAANGDGGFVWCSSLHGDAPHPRDWHSDGPGS